MVISNEIWQVGKPTCICSSPFSNTPQLGILQTAASFAPPSSPAMNVHSVTHAQVLKERCKDSKKHYVDFSVASNNCSYKTKPDSCEHGSKTRGKVLKTHEPSLTNISPVKMGHFHLGLENNLKYSNSRLQLTQAVTHWTVLLAFKGPSCAAIYKMV